MSDNGNNSNPKQGYGDSIFKKRHIEGSRKRANKRGRVRAIIVRPEEMLIFIRDVKKDAPIPPDAQFFGVSADDNTNLIGLHFYSVANPTVNCVNFKPDLLLTLLKLHSKGIIPGDAELTGVCVHQNFTLVRLDVASDRFPALDKTSHYPPSINVRYDGGGELLISEPGNIHTEYQKVPVIRP